MKKPFYRRRVVVPASYVIALIGVYWWLRGEALCKGLTQSLKPGGFTVGDALKKLMEHMSGGK